jgi:hypothetical protein
MSAAFSITNIGAYNGYSTLASDNYVVGVPTDLSQPAMMQNAWSINLVPAISVDGAKVDFPLVSAEDAFKNPAGSYIVDKRDIVSEAEISAKVTIEGNQVVSDISVKNSGSKKMTLDIVYNINGGQDKDFALFSPEGYTKASSNYLVLLQPDYKGQALAVISSQELKPNFVNLFTSKVYAVSYTVSDLEPGQAFSLQIKFYPFVLREEASSGYPNDFFSYMSEPLIKTTGATPTGIWSGSADDKIKSMMDAVGSLPKKGAEFSDLHDVDFNAAEFDSLDTSVYFKQLCINNDMPCQLVIGTKEGLDYAWVRVYNGNWIDIDVYNNEKVAPSYPSLYLEPKTEVHVMPFSDNAEKMINDGTSWISTIGQLNFLFYFIIIIVVACAAIVAFQFKKVILGKLLAKKGRIAESRIDVDGKYEVLNEDIDDPFMKEIIKRIKDKDGIVNISQLVETMHYSKELIEDGITYLAEQRFIRKVM